MGIPSMRWALLLSHSFPMTSMYRWIRSSKEQQLSTVFGDINGWGTLVSVEEILPAQFFSRCNVCYLVNLHHVQSVDKDVVVVAGEPLKIARSRKKEFLTDLARFARVGGV